MKLGLPNWLTLLRILAIPALVATFYFQGAAAHWMALAIFALAGITDYFDGHVARSMQIESRFGKMLDPIADKLIVAAALMMLAQSGILHGVHIIAAIIILSRELLISGLREFLSDDDVKLPVTQLAKFKTTAQMLAIGFLLAGPAGESVFPLTLEFGFVLLWISAALTAYTGYGYVKTAMVEIPFIDAQTGSEAKN